MPRGALHEVSGPAARFTAAQVVAIRRAVFAGRAALRTRGLYHPVWFAEAFIQGGGIQIPGAPHDSRRVRIAAYLIRTLRGDRRIRSNDVAVLRALRRERDRALNETRVTGVRGHAGIKAYRICLPRQGGEGQRCCRQFVERDMFGLGRGRVPLTEVVVLPPCCDGWRYELVPDGIEVSL